MSKNVDFFVNYGLIEWLETSLMSSFIFCRSQLQAGLHQLSQAGVTIGSMQQELEVLKPVIEEKSQVLPGEKSVYMS